MILQHRANGITLVALESGPKSRVWDLCERIIIRGEDGHIVLEGEVGVYIAILCSQQRSEFCEILLVVEQFREVDGLLLSVCEISERGQKWRYERRAHG